MAYNQATGAYLVIQKDAQVGKRVELWKDCTTIGRSRNCDIFIEDITVHRKQASILRTETGYVLRDDHGSGDSFVNGQAVLTERPLNNGDEISFGHTQISFYATEATRPFQLPSSRGRELLLSQKPPISTARLDLTNERTGSQSIDLLPEMTIGRSRECSIFLEDLAVSRHHATLRELPNGTYELIDNRSATGTYVNGKPIAQCILSEGDMVQIGANMFVFRVFHS